jgi:hypothetical protein
MKLAIFVFCGFVLTSGSATAQQEVEPEQGEARQPVQELFLTETVYPQDKHELQITVRTFFDRSRTSLDRLLPLAVEYGLTDRWQVEGSWEGYTRHGAVGHLPLRTARVSVGTKYSVKNVHGSPIHAALGIDAEFPHENAFLDEEGEDTFQLEPFVALAADLGRHVVLFGSLGASLSPRGHTDEALTRLDDLGTISMGGLLAVKRVTLAAEYSTRSDELPWRLDGGALVVPSVTLHLHDRVEFGAAMPIGVSNAKRPGIAFQLVTEFF